MTKPFTCSTKNAIINIVYQVNANSQTILYDNALSISNRTAMNFLIKTLLDYRCFIIILNLREEMNTGG